VVEASAHWTALSKMSRRRFVSTIVLDAVMILAYGTLFGMTLGPIR
jgi:hypothetical protein